MYLVTTALHASLKVQCCVAFANELWDQRQITKSIASYTFNCVISLNIQIDSYVALARIYINAKY